MTPAYPVDPSQLLKILEDRFPTYLEDLRTLVGIDCGTFLRDGVNRVADLMGERFSNAGWSVEREEHAPDGGPPILGDVVVARLPGSVPADRGGRRILLIGHMDTVFPEGAAAERGFRVEGDMAYGPGVTDMKGGLLAGFYAVGALQELGHRDFASITYVCNPDEEIGSPFSTATIQRCAQEVDVCFVLEAARESGAIVSGRKGVADMQVTIRGRSAHAGVEPERGASAILEGANTIVAVHALNGRWPGVTLNVGVVNGGTRPNVVADRCDLHLDLRAPTLASYREAIAEVERVARERTVDGVEIEVDAGASFPPLEKTGAAARLVEQAKAMARDLGFELTDEFTGGASDANTVGGMGVPTLDGLGPVGGAAHSDHEWIDLSSVVPRTALLASMIAAA